MKQNQEEISINYNKLIIKDLNFIKNNELEKATSTFKEAITINHSSFKAYVNLANTYILNKKVDLSLSLLFDFLDKHGFNKDIANYLAKICLNYNLKNELLELFEISDLNSNKYTQDRTYIYFLQGRYFENNKKIKKAINSFENSIKCNESYIYSYLSLFELFDRTNDLNSLKRYVDKGLVNG